jgi:hypothetical protein
MNVRSPLGGPSRKVDRSAGDADYASIGTVYRDYRVADPLIATFVHAALGDARTVLNIGAGTGSYEPTDREVTAVEPSATMRDRRPPHLRAAIDAYAEQLPFPDRCFDAAMGTFTVHQWANLIGGLAEVRRVTRGPVVFLTCDPTLLRTYWLHEYSPEVIDIEAARYPPVPAIAAGLGGVTTVTPVPIPLNCSDGFNDASTRDIAGDVLRCSARHLRAKATLPVYFHLRLPAAVGAAR